MSRGTLVLVVGPSGAGKDSVIGWCRDHLDGNPIVVFPRRVVTRAADPDAEDHDTVDEAGFEARIGRGDFALHWRAHGLGYGIPTSIADDLAKGRSVVVNVSRAVIDDARARFQPVRVVVVTASPAILAERLRQRNRETHAEIDRRLARAATMPAGGDVTVIDNSGALEVAGLALVRIASGD